MDDLHIKHQKITLSCKTLDFYLRMLLLLENLRNHQSLLQHCPIMTEAGAFPNFTTEAGSPFFFKLPIPATLGHTQHYQLSLADGNSPLPPWMVFKRPSCGLAGLALAEDCGIYHLKVSVIGEQCAARFYLHILNSTVTLSDPARNHLSCAEGEMTIWAHLLLQLNPVTLDASQRIRLVSTMADYLHLPLGFVYLFSSRKHFIQHQERLRVCRQGAFSEKIDRDDGKQDASGDVAELLWHIGCQGEERQMDLATVLEYSVNAGGMARLLEAPVLGWRLLCVAGRIQRKVKRDVETLRFASTPNRIFPSPTHVHQTVTPEHSHIYSLPLTKLEPSLSTILLHMSHHRLKSDTCPPSPTKVSKFSSTWNSCTTLIHHYDVRLEIPVATLKTSYMQKIKVTSKSLFSLKQTALYTYISDVEIPLEQQVFTGRLKTTLHTSVCAELDCSLNQISDLNSPKHIAQDRFSTLKIKPLVGVTDTSQSISEYSWTTGTFPLPFLTAHISVVIAFVGDPSADTALASLPSSTRHSVYPSLLLTPASYSVTSTLTHEAVNRKSLTTRLTLQPQPKETPLRTGAYRASHTDSESQPAVSSLGDIIYKGPVKDHSTAKLTLHNLPSVPHPPLTENYNDAPLLSSGSKTIQSRPPSNKITSTQPFPDVSPTSYLMTKQLSVTQHFDTIPHQSSTLNQDVMSQLNGTTQDVSSTTVAGQLTPPEQTELEPSLSASMLEPSVSTFTPALPSKLGSNIINSVYSVESLKSLKASSPTTPMLQTLSRSFLYDTGVSSRQNNLESPAASDLESKSSAQLQFDQNALMQTFLRPTHLSSVIEISYFTTKTHHITSAPPDQLFKEQPAAKSAHDTKQLIPSVQLTPHALLLGESQTEKFSHISFTRMTASMYVNTAALTATAPSPSVTYPLFIHESVKPVPEHFDPSAPSTVQELYTTSFIHQIQNPDPSFPSCGQPVAQDHVCVHCCNTQIRGTYLESTVEHVLYFMTSYSQDEKQFLMFDSATPQLNISGTLPSLDGGSLSVIKYTSLSPITSALNDNCVSVLNSLLICQTDSSRTVTNGRPTQQILSTSLSQFYGMSTALLTSLQPEGLSSHKRQSSVHPTPPSALISRSMNLPPKVLQSIPMLMATVGFPFHYSIPPKTFLDPEDGGADALSLEISLIDGPPISIGTWLALDGLELHGVPLEVDLQFAPQHLLLAARDAQGLSTQLPLILDLRRSPADPCHVFTLTAQRSLHSILRRRHRVELLLSKLSRFFNASSDHHLSVVSMRPGSTVVSWYNYSLCGTSHNRVRQCHVGQIRSMWLAMRSADGSVKAAFREAMLPEFPVTKVGPVSYRQDCFSSTSAPTFDGSTPGVHTASTPALGSNTSLSPSFNTCGSAAPAVTSTSQQTNHYQRLAGMFAALLVVCLLILIVLLIATVLHFCKGRGRSRTVAIWPAGRVLSLQSRDLRAIRPRRPPIFQPELPPPPLRLWIVTQGDEGQLSSASEKRRKTLDRAPQPHHPCFDFSSI